MCFGHPEYGQDHYYQKWLEQQRQSAEACAANEQAYEDFMREQVEGE